MKNEHIIAVSLAFILIGGIGWEKWRTAHPPVPSAEQKVYVEVVPERALFDNISIRVIIAARIRPTAKIGRIDFVHVGGYFIDQTGTSYSPGFTRVNNMAFPTTDGIEPRENHLLRTGETYRYCLGPAKIDVDRSSEEAAANAIKKVTVHLEGVHETNVPVIRWLGLDPTADWPRGPQ